LGVSHRGIRTARPTERRQRRTACGEADPEHPAPCRGSGKPSTLRNSSRACGRMSLVYEAEAEPETEAEPPCSPSGFWFGFWAKPCSDRRRRRFLGFRVWGFGLRLGLWKSGKRIVQAERSGSEAEAEHPTRRLQRGILRCGSSFVYERGEVAAGVSSLRGYLGERRGCCGTFLPASITCCEHFRVGPSPTRRLQRGIPRCGVSFVYERGEVAAGVSSLRGH
jgi:hypothetical protein